MKTFMLTTISCTFLLTLTINNVQAQKKNVNKAQIWAESGEQLDNALKEIEYAETQEKTKDWVKTYYVKGLVYEAIAASYNPEFQNICENPLIKAFDNFKKAYDMKDGTDYQRALDLKFFSLSNSLIQKAIETFNVGDFENSFVYFAKTLEIKEMPVFKGEVDTSAIFNTAMAAQRIKKYDEAIVYYNRLIDYGYGAGDTHVLLASCYKDKGENENYLKQLKIGYEKYPANADLIGGIINYYLKADNSEGAFEYLNMAKQKDPSNAQYYLAEAQVFSALGDEDKAKGLYLKSIQLNPELFEAHYNLGVTYYNEAVVLLDEERAIACNAKFKESLAYFETCHKLSPDDAGIMNILKKLYSFLKMDDKYEQISKEMK